MTMGSASSAELGPPRAGLTPRCCARGTSEKCTERSLRRDPWPWRKALGAREPGRLGGRGVTFDVSDAAEVDLLRRRLEER